MASVTLVIVVQVLHCKSYTWICCFVYCRGQTCLRRDTHVSRGMRELWLITLLNGHILPCRVMAPPHLNFRKCFVPSPPVRTVNYAIPGSQVQPQYFPSKAVSTSCHGALAVLYTSPPFFLGPSSGLNRNPVGVYPLPWPKRGSHRAPRCRFQVRKNQGHGGPKVVPHYTLLSETRRKRKGACIFEWGGDGGAQRQRSNEGVKQRRGKRRGMFYDRFAACAFEGGCFPLWRKSRLQL